MNDQPAVQIGARDLALQKIGRAVVNFQKMEAMPKFLAIFSSVVLDLGLPRLPSACSARLYIER